MNLSVCLAYERGGAERKDDIEVHCNVLAGQRNFGGKRKNLKKFEMISWHTSRVNNARGVE